MTGGNYSHLNEKAKREERKNQHLLSSLAELKSKAPEDHKFRQQHLIDNFIVDFVCLSKKC
jgi:very-short-patch-repair endonuclease